MPGRGDLSRYRARHGQMGGVQTTIQNLEIVQVDAERNVLLVKGNVPGAKKSFVEIKSAIKAAN